MRDRMATPDIMSNLMCDSVEQKNNKTIKPSVNIEEQLPAPSILKEPKEKTTFNLSEKILRGLEDCWIEARRLAGDKQISKTLIVERALEAALEDFNKEKQSSRFYSAIVSNKKIKQ